MSTNTVETVNTTADKLKLGLVVALLVAGLTGFYLLSGQSTWIRWGVLLVGLALAVATFLLATPGQRLIGFGRDSVREIRKVVWPTRKEAMQMTAYVFAFVLVMAIFLWLTDKTLEWVFYDLILGWKK